MNWENFKREKEKKLSEAAACGEADKAVLPILSRINKNKNLVSTSSCFGRMVLLEFEGDKKESNFYRKWHRKINVKEVKTAINEYSGKKTLWFKFEPFILHVAAKDIESAKDFVETARKLGIKRGGIQTIAKEKVMIELQGNCQLIVPVKAVGNWDSIVKLANKMFETNSEKLKQLEKAI